MKIYVGALLSLAFAQYALANSNNWHAWNARRLAFALSTSGNVKNELLDMCAKLKASSPTGVFITKAEDRKDLLRVAAELEAVSDPVSPDAELLGNWTLLSTTNSVESPLKSAMPSLPFNLPANPLQAIQESLQDAAKKSVNVVQRIRSKNDSGMIDRVDNVIEFTPLKTLGELIGDAASSLKETDINPLEVTSANVALVHKGEVQSTTPVYRTKIALESIIVTAAGTSQVLDPEGQMLLGVNVPLGEFLNAGYFDTTYLDEDTRISRSKVGPIEYLRVFSRQGVIGGNADEENTVEDEEEEAEIDKHELIVFEDDPVEVDDDEIIEEAVEVDESESESESPKGGDEYETEPDSTE